MSEPVPRPAGRPVLFGFIAGAGLVLAFQTAWVGAHGWDPTVLLRVGAGLSHRAAIEAELGPVRTLDPLGHDGQINYLIARDPFCRHGTDDYLREFDNPPYRYRRILYPLAAGGGGGFGPWLTLAGLIAGQALGAGLTGAAGAALARAWKLPGLTVPLLLINPGLYLSAQTLTADALALGCALAGVALWERRAETAASVLLAAAVAVKETSLLVTACLAMTLLVGRRPGAATRLVVASILPWAAWAIWVAWRIPGGGGGNNFSWPGAGIVTAVGIWPRQAPAELVQGVMALLLVVGAIALAWRTPNGFLRLSCLAWAGLALVLSADVWGYPGNLLRALAPLWTFAVLAYGTSAATPGTRSDPIP